MEIAEFLLARIAEDEERALFVQSQTAGSPWPEGTEPWRLSWQDEYDILCIEPSRALAECEAKRRIVGDYGFREHAPGRGLSIFGERILGALASVYADHPDFAPAWRS